MWMGKWVGVWGGGCEEREGREEIKKAKEKKRELGCFPKKSALTKSCHTQRDTHTKLALTS